MLENYGPFLKSLQDLCPTAHIGGGAVRDSLLDRPIRDIDLFLDDTVTDSATALMRSKFGYIKVGEWTSYESFSDPAVVRLAKFEKADETIPVCLIGMNKPRGVRENIARFDFGVCMVAWDGDTVCTTPEYDADVRSKTFTLLRADNLPQFTYSMSRFEKLTADRYAGWDLVVPSKFERLARQYAVKKLWCDGDDDNDLKYRDAHQRLRPKSEPATT